MSPEQKRDGAPDGAAAKDTPAGASETTDSAAKESEAKGPAAVKRGQSRVLPDKAAEDEPRAWGDRDDDHDAWLKEQRPPHWG